MKALVRMPATAVNEVSSDQFVKACVQFQQAKTLLSQHLSGADVTACDNVSRAVYNLANKALTRKAGRPPMNAKALKGGKHVSLVDRIVQAVQGKKSFDIQTVIDSMKRRGTLPKAENTKNYVSNLLSMNPTRFKRLERGVYCLKASGKKKLVYAPKKTPKELPAKTA